MVPRAFAQGVEEGDVTDLVEEHVAELPRGEHPRPVRVVPDAVDPVRGAEGGEGHARLDPHRQDEGGPEGMADDEIGPEGRDALGLPREEGVEIGDGKLGCPDGCHG